MCGPRARWATPHIGFLGDTLPAPASGNVVVNNTVVMAADARWALNIQNGSTDNVVFNNIFLNLHPWHGAVNISADSLPGFVCDHNAVTGRFTLDDEATLLDLAGWQAATGQDVDSFVAMADALFAGPGDYHALVGSAASQSGVAALAGYSAPTADHDGHNRPTDAIDLGAFQNDVPVGTGTPEWSDIVMLPWKDEPIAILDGLA